MEKFPAWACLVDQKQDFWRIRMRKTTTNFEACTSRACPQIEKIPGNPFEHHCSKLKSKSKSKLRSWKSQKAAPKSVRVPYFAPRKTQEKAARHHHAPTGLYLRCADWKDVFVGALVQKGTNASKSCTRITKIGYSSRNDEAQA